eukprot:snap_masked-scaffold_5-processed-gene-19.40-mRNA-1 protein AED:1.00 eAED:1.00 QI:0/0/0/0/1/1/2/0/65
MVKSYNISLRTKPQENNLVNYLVIELVDAEVGMSWKDFPLRLTFIKTMKIVLGTIVHIRNEVIFS